MGTKSALSLFILLCYNISINPKLAVRYMPTTYLQCTRRTLYSLRKMTLLACQSRLQCFRIPKTLTLCLTALLAPTVSAHPHSWVDLKTYIEGEEGVVTGLKMEWTFDAMTSAYMLDGEDTSAENELQTLERISASVLENMLYEHYFTYFYDGETPIRYKVAHSDTLTRDRAKLVLSFELPLSKPKPVTEDSLRLLIFDSSYFVDMAWKADTDVVLSEGLAEQCDLKIIEPNPTPEQMSYALSLPVDADPDNTLGELFTQTAKLNCVTNSETS